MNDHANQNIQYRCNIPALAGIVALCAFLGAVPARAQDADKLTLHEAVTMALQNSRDVKLAQVQYNVALGEVGVDRAAFLPNLYTGSGAAYTHGFPSLPGGQAPAVFQLDYTQALFDPLLKGAQHAAEDRAKNQKLELDRVRDDVIVRTATSYLELAEIRRSIELMLGEQASGGKILQAIRERVAANQELPIEVTRTQLTLARVAERIVKSEDREAFLEAQIRDLTGIPDGQSLEVGPEDASFAAQPASAQSEA
jgi:outer membrane protein